MFTCVSLRACCFPRRIPIQRIFLRSTTSTADRSSLSSYRSASRFSLKIARFLFLKRRINNQTGSTRFVPISTHAHYSKSETPDDLHELARSFLLSLEPEHRKILEKQLSNVETSLSTNSMGKTNITAVVLPSQLAVVFLETGLPYIGFGFVDNFVMLVAGETIETFFGAALCLSTMAAAGLGNAISDVLGIGLADRIERTCGRFLAVFGISAPQLTAAQWRTRTVHSTQLMSKVICIFLGCVLGMCPLLFRDTSTNKSTTKKED
ncbi:unnamed protein product [Adineta ricciae]|uniref:Transmembrane protein 65 n=1 Tax=Adineta ricciae TaxID=249248 RepID=A0A815UEF7_ADIRI|nr:unnamed protein product [Adineta ricciae]